MENRVKNAIMVAVVAMALLLGATGCTSCRICGGDDGGKPVAPEAYSNESGSCGDPSLSYTEPWWMD